VLQDTRCLSKPRTVRTWDRRDASPPTLGDCRGVENHRILRLPVFSEPAPPTDHENHGEIRQKSILKLPTAIQNWPPANPRTCSTPPKYTTPYTNRRRILCRFQKCTTPYVHPKNCASYSHFTDENSEIWGPGPKSVKFLR